MAVVLITGATAGIGAEFARQLAAQKNDLVLVARDRDRLETGAEMLRAAHGVHVEVLAADLVSARGLAAVERRVAASTAPVDILINNAGFDLREPFHENTAAQEQELLDLLVAVPMRLTHAALGQMLPRRRGTIVNIASVAGFTPRGTYGAAKAWLLSFSRWAHIYYRGRGISITAVAPGFVRTEFHDRMKVSTRSVPGVMWLSSEQVVRIALRDVRKGKALSVPTARYRVIVALTKLLPARVTAAGALRDH